ASTDPQFGKLDNLLVKPGSLFRQRVKSDADEQFAQKRPDRKTRVATEDPESELAEFGQHLEDKRQLPVRRGDKPAEFTIGHSFDLASDSSTEKVTQKFGSQKPAHPLDAVDQWPDSATASNDREQNPVELQGLEKEATERIAVNSQPGGQNDDWPDDS